MYYLQQTGHRGIFRKPISWKLCSNQSQLAHTLMLVTHTHTLRWSFTTHFLYDPHHGTGTARPGSWMTLWLGGTCLPVWHAQPELQPFSGRPGSSDPCCIPGLSGDPRGRNPWGSNQESWPARHSSHRRRSRGTRSALPSIALSSWLCVEV